MLKSVFLIAILAAAMIGVMVPNTYADYFAIETKCEGQHLIISIADENGEFVQNVEVYPSEGVRNTSHLFDKFTSDEDGKVSINYSNNTGFVKISKPGFNSEILVVEICSQNFFF